MLYTYCFISYRNSTLSLPQGFVSELQLIEHNAIAAVVEPELPIHELEENDQTLMQAVLHHDWVICEIFRNQPVLPLRFGTYFQREQDLREHLASHAQKYHDQLQNFTGKLELTVKLTPIPFSQNSSSPKAETGKSYLKAKKQQYQEKNNYQYQQQQALKELEAKLAELYPNLIHGEPQESTERFYLLMNQADLSIFSEKIKQWQQELKGWEIEVSDPLPPYHFL